MKTTITRIDLLTGVCLGSANLLVGVGLLIHQKKKQQRLKFHQAQISLVVGKTVNYNSP